MASTRRDFQNDEISAIPGTEFLYDQSNTSSDSPERFQEYQHLRRGDSHILLVPQPSTTDPSDPLKWSAATKIATFSNALSYAFLGGVTGPIMAAWMVPGSLYFKLPLQRMSNANGATLICQGLATTLWMPFAVKYGRRPVYLLSTILMVCACVWLGLASQATYTSFLVGRAFLGIWEAPIESIVPSTVTDIFFLHERGAMISLYGLAVLGGNELGPTLSAFIIQYLGMNWAFYIVAAALGLTFVTMVLGMPETKFTGARPVIVPRSKSDRDEKIVIDDKGQVTHHEHELTGASLTEQSRARSWWQQILRLPRSDPKVSLTHTFLRPFVLVAYPTVLWSCLTYGMALSWNVIIGCILAQLFAPPPYGFDPAAQGLVFLSPLIGSIIGTYLCGPVGDQVANYLTRRGNGIREPEMRLPVCLIAAALTLLGGVGTGIMFEHQIKWIGPVIGLGIISTGAQMGATLSMSYALDCHKEQSVELMVAVASLKSLIAWIWTWVINDWLAQSGPLIVFSTVAAINTVVYLTTILLFMRGKEVRIWLAQRHLGKALEL